MMLRGRYRKKRARLLANFRGQGSHEAEDPPFATIKKSAASLMGKPKGPEVGRHIIRSGRLEIKV